MVEIRNRCLLSLVLDSNPGWLCIYMYKKCEKEKEGERGWLKLVHKRRNIKNCLFDLAHHAPKKRSFLVRMTEA